ncbi:(2R)-3-sulfolactate dehydrogenase (NADP+) [Rubricella aquisinus]|uniref:(2R)-3-sulfolactate dehydrogenase (NADP+) n=1 Tax=Rubricella aquisinus TaxID=2028108 RepID=A0A840WTX0_9RHOB|nr:Ldh family oxidoreductase [Rubricella aquisinus]MBB5514660.1 (2R)-3-sulfolactate dehydrogenase (NADP+) [Rubricella aquisinus]
MSSETLTVAEAGSLIEAALLASETSELNAKSVARALLAAEVDGQKGHGLSRVPSYTKQSKVGKIQGRVTPVLEDVKPGVFRVDAGYGFAYPAFDMALPELERRVKEIGVAACAIHKSHHFGVAGHHCEWLAERGMVGFVYGNAPKALAPTGSKVALLGTNPIAFAAPAPGAPLVIDMAVTTVARGKILAARESGQSIPADWALGPDGEPTTDAATALKGTMQPIGGPKGAALALMVEVMSACLAGAAFGSEASSLFEPEGGPPDLGQTIIAIDAQALSGGAFAERMAALAAIYEALDGARLPGQRRLANRAKAASDGLTAPTALLTQIREIAG